MSRKRCRRRPIVPLPPRGLRPKLTSGQITDLGLCHWATVEAIRTGTAGEMELMSWCESVHTWSRVAELLATGVPEMRTQLELAERMVQRWQRTGRVLFDGADLQLARDGADVMDQLASIVDRPTAVAAVDWSEARLAELTRRMQREEAAGRVTPNAECRGSQRP